MRGGFLLRNKWNETASKPFDLYEKVNTISNISRQDDNFAMEAGRQPITFENPLYATSPGMSGDPAVIHATQVLQLPENVFQVLLELLPLTLVPWRNRPTSLRNDLYRRLPVLLASLISQLPSIHRWPSMQAANIWKTTLWTRLITAITELPSSTHRQEMPNLCRWQFHPVVFAV